MQNVFQKAAPQQGQVPEGEMPEGEEGDVDENNPAFLKAKEMVKSKLFEEELDQEVLAAIQSAPELAKGLAEQSFTMLQLVDDAMQQEGVPDELYLVLGLEILGDMASIAQAGGLPVDGRVTAAATRELIQMVVESLGGDMSQVGEMMRQIDEGEIGAALDQMGG